jgi:AAA+ superfamily predicted ATPase
VRESLIRSLRLAVEQSPDDVPLRVHLAALLFEEGDVGGAVAALAAALTLDPDDEHARAGMRRPEGPSHDTEAPLRDDGAVDEVARIDDGATSTCDVDDVDEPRGLDHLDVRDGHGGPARDEVSGFDWATAEDDLHAASFRIDRPAARLSDVGGMADVKAAIDQAFLVPLRNPELRQAYGATLRGGLLLYGPPGCGKTHLARALAGELDAAFLSVSRADLHDHASGRADLAVADLFAAARRAAPCVLFLDEVDTLLPRRSSADGWTAALTTQVLVGVGSRNDGLFVLAATNRPWEVDTAARRPGRLDRTLLVLPPDGPARREIARRRLEGRPVGHVDLDGLARRTEGLSGADVAYVCDLALRRALSDSVAGGTPRPVSDRDLRRAVSSVTSSVGEWAASARSVVAYGVDDGTFAELRAFLGVRRGR